MKKLGKKINDRETIEAYTLCSCVCFCKGEDLKAEEGADNNVTYNLY